MRHPKDPILAIEAWKHVVEDFADARLTLCGDGPLLEPARGRASDPRLASRVQCPGRVADLGPHYSQSSVFLLVSDVEGGITMATLEAMSEGLVPVVSDVGDAFLLDHARAGVVAARRSARAHADAVSSLLDAPDDLLAMRDRAMAFARERWTTDDFVLATEGFYAEVRQR